MNFRDETDISNLNKIDTLLEGQPEFLREFNNHLSSNTSPATRVVYLRAIIAFFDYVRANGTEITEENLENLSPTFMEGYFAYLAHYEKDGEIRKNSRVTLKRKQSSLNAIYNYLLLEHRITKNPLFTLRNPKPPEKLIVRMDKEETSSFLETVEWGGNMTKREEKYYQRYHTRDYAMIILLLSTGIRISECVGLDIEDLNLEKHAIRVIRKGSKEGIVYFNDDVTETMKNYLSYRKRIKSESPALFLSAQKKRFTPRAVEYLIKKYVDRCPGLMKNITPHKLRSTFGTALYEETSDIYLVAEVLGHKDIETTRKHYADMSEQRKIDNRGAVDWNRKEGEMV